MSRDSVGPYVWMLLGSMSFAVMSSLVHALGDEQRCSWPVTAAMRTGLALLFAVALAKLGGAQLVFLRPRSLWMRSLAGTVSLVCTFFAMTRRVPLSSVLAITSTFPIWVAILQWPLVGEKPARSVWLSIFAAVSGVFLMLDPKLEDSNIAALFAVVASVATAVAMLGLHRLQWLDTRAVVAHFSGVALIFCLVALVSVEQRIPLEQFTDGTTVVMLLGVGISATAGQLCLTKAFTIGSPARVSVVGLTQIVFSMVLAGESWDLKRSLGIALVMVPTAWVMVMAGRNNHRGERRVGQRRTAVKTVGPSLY